MSDEVISTNTQAAEPANPPSPTSTGPSLEDIQAKVAELERAREGLIRDVQHERSKRKELEQRFAAPAPSASSPVTQDVKEEDELAKVLKPYIAPLEAEARQATAQLQRMQAEAERQNALAFLSNKTKKSIEEIVSDKSLQERLVATANKWGLSGSLTAVTQRAYELMEMENAKAKDVEAARNVTVASTQTLPVGTPPSPAKTAKQYGADEFNRLSTQEFDRLSQTGSFRKSPDGTFVYTPRS
jgi:hypothetical protein